MSYSKVFNSKNTSKDSDFFKNLRATQEMMAVRKRSFSLDKISMADEYLGQKLSLGKAAMALISTCVGGGIVSLPYALASIGIIVGLSFHLFIICCIGISVVLCMKVKDNLGYDSYSELAFVCFGRPSVFVLNAVICLCTVGITSLYLILSSDIGIALL